MKLKLGIRKSNGSKILYAQEEHDFADFILSFLSFPLGGVVRKLDGNSSVGSIDGLYKSIAKFALDGDKYMMSYEVKDRLVEPHLAPEFKLSNQIVPIFEPGVLQYYCYHQRYSSNHKESIVHVQFLKDGEHKNEVGNFRLMKLVNSKSATGNHNGFVKGLAMYLVTDDLVVAPLSPISALDFLNCLKTPIDDLKEKEVTITIEECFRILKASLSSTTALTKCLSHLLTKVKEEK